MSLRGDELLVTQAFLFLSSRSLPGEAGVDRRSPFEGPRLRLDRLQELVGAGGLGDPTRKQSCQVNRAVHGGVSESTSCAIRHRLNTWHNIQMTFI